MRKVQGQDPGKIKERKKVVIEEVEDVQEIPEQKETQLYDVVLHEVQEYVVMHEVQLDVEVQEVQPIHDEQEVQLVCEDQQVQPIHDQQEVQLVREEQQVQPIHDQHEVQFNDKVHEVQRFPEEREVQQDDEVRVMQLDVEAQPSTSEKGREKNKNQKRKRRLKKINENVVAEEVHEGQDEEIVGVNDVSDDPAVHKRKKGKFVAVSSFYGSLDEMYISLET